MANANEIINHFYLQSEALRESKEQQAEVANEISHNISTIREVAHETMEGAQLLQESGKKLKALTDNTKVMLSQYQL